MKNAEILNRREQIVTIIRSAGKINTEEAAAMFGVSKETIRQDLLYLSHEGIIKKVYGGAVLCKNDRIESLPIRETVNFLTKDKIARTAAKYLPEGECIIGMDMGSTVALLGTYLSRRRDLLVITNSHRVLQTLVTTENRTLSLGGEYNKEEMAYYSDESPSLVKNLTLDLYFMGTSGVKGRGGVCTKGFQESFIKNQLIQRSKKKIVLADSSKFQTTSLIEVAPWSSLDLLITDEDIPADIKKDLEQYIPVVIAQ